VNVDQAGRIGGEESVRRFDVESSDGILQLSHTESGKIVLKIGFDVKSSDGTKRSTRISRFGKTGYGEDANG